MFSEEVQAAIEYFDMTSQTAQTFERTQYHAQVLVQNHAKLKQALFAADNRIAELEREVEFLKNVSSV